MRRIPLFIATAGSLLLASACTPPGTPQPEPSAPAAPAATSANFRCGDLLLGADFDNVTETVTLSWSGHRRVLPQAVAASGARFADDKGNEFWNKGDEATLTLAGGEALACGVTDDVSPWDEARARGVAFRAIGTEPGWMVEVDGGEAPALRAQLDYGERSLEIERVVVAADGTGFSGTMDDDTAVYLVVLSDDCSDGMSDQTYPARVQLTVGERVLHGCGAFLDR
jgi:uncharacterized membrane protein/membrane-bound inhibitor of C-type lysozyme